MKKSILAACTALACATSAHAALAVPGTLAAYLALGPGGVTIGSTTFSDFTLLPTQAGAIPVDPADILVNPIDVFNNPGFTFVFDDISSDDPPPAVSVGPGVLLELRISYKVTETAIFGASVGLLGSVVVPDGVNTAVLDLTGPLPPTTLIAFDTGLLSDNPVSAAFAPVSTLTAELDIVVDGGLAGGATLGSVTNQFAVAQTAVPEPGTVFAGLAALALCGTSRRRLPVSSLARIP